MDQTKYWMLTRRKVNEKPLLTPHIAVGSSYYESWEERAFAEDSAGHLGGCIWPPRSYSCSFCAREFRSAQALGGHMNVHRRDRARLKLSSASADENSIDSIPHQNYHLPCPPLASPYSSQIVPLAYNPNTNPNPNSICAVLAYPPSPNSRSLAAVAKSGWSEHISSPPLVASSAGQDHGKKEALFRAVQSAGDHPKPATICSLPELSVERGELKLSVLGCRTRRDFEDDDDEEAKEENITAVIQRRRINIAASPFFLNSSSSKHQQLDDAKVLKLCPSSPVLEELDLELRLGEAPKVVK